MGIKDDDYLGELIEGWDDLVLGYKKGMGAEMERICKTEVFDRQGPVTPDTDPLNPRGQNPQWPPLSDITVELKGSSQILKDTQNLRNFLKYWIEDSDMDGKRQMIKLGWDEDMEFLPYIAAIHEFGLTGRVFLTPEGVEMGGAPIGRTPEARAKIRGWFASVLGKRTSGVIVIPERSMLRKTAEIMLPNLEQSLLIAILQYLRSIAGKGVD